MTLGNVKIFGAALLAAVCVSPVASATTIYNSGGFESPTFTTGALPGQDGWVSLSTGAGGNSTATVHDVASTKPIQAGSQAVTIFRDGLDDSGSTLFNVPLSVNHDTVVIIDWDMYTPYSGDQDPDPQFESFGPGFSLESYVNTTSGLKRVAGIGIDSADGAFYQIPDNTGTTEAIFTNAGLLLDQWQSWQVILDFTNEVYYVSVDGTVLTPGGVPMMENIDYAGGDRLVDASIVPFATDHFYFDIEGEAYIDNYRIGDDSVVPEPTTGLLALGLLGLTRGRRRVA